MRIARETFYFAVKPRSRFTPACSFSLIMDKSGAIGAIGRECHHRTSYIKSLVPVQAAGPRRSAFKSSS